MYRRHAVRVGLTCETLDERPDGRMVLLRVSGGGAERLRGEAGGHSIQHKTRSRRDDRIHTSTVTVAVLDDADLRRTVALVDRGDVRVDTFRGSGSGGQHRNKTDTAVRATHLPTGEVATVTSGRSQTRNREAALAVLSARLARRADESHAAHVQRKRRSHTRSARAEANRVYDLVRGMVRDGRTGRKVRRVERILDGELDELL